MCAHTLAASVRFGVPTKHLAVLGHYGPVRLVKATRTGLLLPAQLAADLDRGTYGWDEGEEQGSNVQGMGHQEEDNMRAVAESLGQDLAVLRARRVLVT